VSSSQLDSFIADFLAPQSALKTAVTQHSQTYFDQDATFPFDAAIKKDLKEYLVSGKMFRGLLFYHVADLLGAAASKETKLQIAAALELYGSAILLHDDIMDQDEQRRGLETPHITWQKYASQSDFKEPAHWGMSAAICAGDYLFFMAGSLLMAVDNSKRAVELMRESQYQLRMLGLAQIEDLRLAASDQLPTQQEVIQMFIGKTGHYTGEWPLVIAGIMAGCEQPEIDQLRQIGIDLGVLYQLTDDRIGLFGDPQVAGKSNNSDIKEQKKTLYYLLLHQQVSSEERTAMEQIFGNPEATAAECDTIRELCRSYGIDEQVDQEISKQAQQVQQTSQQLKNKKVAAFLENCAAVLVARSK